ncbi:MAG TPA: glycosyltransferase family 39 protein, partial [Pyrinomonadaceae bacterium]|nr:glycosyltransferase family 39 protein [Pyrinomonadaceae bacterium]
MNALLALLALTLSVGVSFLSPSDGPAAVVLCAALSALAALAISRHETHGRFLVQVFVAGVLMRAAIGTLIYYFNLQEFFGGDALTYHYHGTTVLQFWRGDIASGYYDMLMGARVNRDWGMPYLVAVIYGATGQNMLAVQFFNGVLGAATAPVIFLCARHIFQNLRVAKVAALLVAFFPSLVLWSSQGLKDGPIVFLLAVAMLATLKLGERLSWKYVAVLVLAMFTVLSLRFYVFYMVAAAVGGAFVIGMRPITSQSFARQIVIVVAMGISLTYLGVLRTAGTQIESFGNLQAVQVSRADLSRSANSGFGSDVDVSTTAGALSAIPVGAIYLLFAPFPWQVANLRQSITIPEMVIWWGSFPLLILGVWFTLRYRMRQALPILIFTTMLTL